MRQLAGRRGQDPEIWGIIGLGHDLDYEQFPQQHCQKVQERKSEPMNCREARQTGQRGLSQRKVAGSLRRISTAVVRPSIPSNARRCCPSGIPSAFPSAEPLPHDVESAGISRRIAGREDLAAAIALNQR